MKISTLLLIIALCITVLAAIKVKTVVEHDGGFGCSIDWVFLPDAGSASEDGREYGLLESSSYGSGLVFRFDAVQLRFVPNREIVHASVGVENSSDETRSLSLSMLLTISTRSDGVTHKPIQTRTSTNLAEDVAGNYDIQLPLAGGARNAAIFNFDFGLFDKNLPFQTMEQTIFVGEVEANDVLVTRQLTRHRKAFNCIAFGVGHGFIPG